MMQVEQTILQRLDNERNENVYKVERVASGLMNKYIQPMLTNCKEKMQQMLQKLQSECTNYEKMLQQKLKLLEILNPEKVLAQGYAILSGKISPGSVVKITTIRQEIKAEIKEVYER